MSATMNAYKSDLLGIYLLQRLAMPDGYQPVFGAMDNVSVTLYIRQPFIGAEMKAEYDTKRQDR